MNSSLDKLSHGVARMFFLTETATASLPAVALSSIQKDVMDLKLDVQQHSEQANEQASVLARHCRQTATHSQAFHEGVVGELTKLNALLYDVMRTVSEGDHIVHQLSSVMDQNDEIYKRCSSLQKECEELKAKGVELRDEIDTLTSAEFRNKHRWRVSLGSRVYFRLIRDHFHRWTEAVFAVIKYNRQRHRIISRRLENKWEKRCFFHWWRVTVRSQTMRFKMLRDRAQSDLEKVASALGTAEFERIQESMRNRELGSALHEHTESSMPSAMSLVNNLHLAIPSTVGLQLCFDTFSGLYRVHAVQPGYSAEKSQQIQVGDVVMAIDNESLQGKNESSVSEMLVGVLGEEMELQVWHSDGRSQVVKLPRDAPWPLADIVISETLTESVNFNRRSSRNETPSGDEQPKTKEVHSAREKKNDLVVIDRLGISLKQKGSFVSVEKIEESSQLRSSGLDAGDLIVQIGAEDVSDSTLASSLLQLAMETGNTSLEILKPNGETLSIAL